MRYLPVLIFLLFSGYARAQDKNSDSTDSYFEVNAGIGDDYFTRKPVAQNDALKKLYYTAGIGYYHRSGLSLALSSYYTKDAESLSIYQAAITPSYDYEKGKHFGFGVSFTHYFNKDSVSFYQSPLVNEYYGYLTYKNEVLSPSLSFTYASGKQKLKVGNQLRTVKASDYSVGISLDHDFTWKNALAKEDAFSFTPVLSLNAGSSAYGFNNASAKSKGRLKKIGGKKTFELQDISLSLGLEYNFHKFSISPSVNLDYYVPDSGGFSSLETFTISYSF